MPILTWPSKTDPQFPQAELVKDSMVFPQGEGYPDQIPQNSLFLGDNLAVMSALLAEWEGRIQLIYADPPFFTNRRFPTRIGKGEDSRRPQDWQLAEGYPDHWPSLDAYLNMLYPRLVLMHQLLAPTGTLYLHLDWHANSYARLLLDEIFGPDRLLNEIVWAYHGPSPIRTAFNRKHDTILAYTKSENYTFNPDAVRQPYDPSTIKTFNSSRKAGFGKVPNLERGKVPEDWWYFPVVARLHHERTGYPTQKPEGLLERIVLASSNPGDRVADFFCGSGTTALVASRLGRHFLASDVSWRAVHTTRSRLVSHPGAPFSIEHIKGSERDVQRMTLPPIRLLEDHIIELKNDLMDELDFWEADPAWDGSIFRSAAQATRQRNGEATTQRLKLPGLPDGGPVCVRIVTIHGEHFQFPAR